MGFAGAFASGLVKGFHQNILNEQKARAAEEAKLDSYEAMIFKTSMEGGEDVNTSAINKISSLVKDGRKQLDSRGSIDIFGRPGNRLKLDMLNTAGIVNNTNNTYTIGSVKMPVDKDFYAKTLRGDTAKRAGVFFDSVNRLGPEKIAQLFKTKADKDAFGVEYNNNIMNFLAKDVLKEGKIVRIMGVKNIPGYENFRGMVSSQSDYQIAKSKLSKNGDYDKNSFILPLTGSENGILTSFEDMKFTEEEVGNLNGLAKLHGYEDAGEFIFDASSRYAKKDNFVKGLQSTLELYGMNAHAPKSVAEMATIGKHLIEKELDNDPLAMAYMLAPLVYKADNIRLDELRNLGFKEALNNSDFNAQFKKFQGSTLKEFKENYAALNRSEQQLNQLMTLTEKGKLAAGTLQQKLFGFFNNVFSTGGLLDQVTSLVGNGKNDKETDKVASRIQSTIKQIETEHGEGSIQAKIATLKFVLAADLARAEDSQGRLSDQDLARNMAKLGSSQGTIPNQLAAMGMVMQDVTNKRNNMKVLFGVTIQAETAGYFTREQRALVQADKMGRNYVNEYRRTQPYEFRDNLPAGAMASMEDVNNIEKFELPDPNLQGPNQETVHQSKTDGSYVLVKDGAIVKIISKAQEQDARQNNEIQFTESLPDSEFMGSGSVTGNTVPVPVGKSNVTPQGAVPPVTVPKPPATVTQNVFTGDELGVTISTLGQADASGYYNIGSKKYRIKTTTPLTLELITP